MSLPLDVELALVVFPNDSELDDTLWNRDDLEAGSVFWVLLEEAASLKGRDKLVVGLLELWLGWKVGHICGFEGVGKF